MSLMPRKQDKHASIIRFSTKISSRSQNDAFMNSLVPTFLRHVKAYQYTFRPGAVFAYICILTEKRKCVLE